MNAFAWTAVVCLALVVLGALLLLLAWLNDRWHRRAALEPERLEDEPRPDGLARSAGQIALSAAIGLAAGILYALGYLAQSPIWFH